MNREIRPQDSSVRVFEPVQIQRQRSQRLDQAASHSETTISTAFQHASANPHTPETMRRHTVQRTRCERPSVPAEPTTPPTAEFNSVIKPPRDSIRSRRLKRSTHSSREFLSAAARFSGTATATSARLDFPNATKVVLLADSTAKA